MMVRRAVLIRLVPTLTKSFIRIWQQLQLEVREFDKEDRLKPVRDTVLSAVDHYWRYSNRSARKIPLLKYDKSYLLPTSQEGTQLPSASDIHTIDPVEITRKSWVVQTPYTIRKYDKWYWRMRLNKTPLNISWLALLGKRPSKLMRKIHWYHANAAMERNSKRQHPPHGLFLGNRC